MTAASPRRAIDDGHRRAVIGRVRPAVDGGRFDVKRVAGDEVVVEADAFADGHDALRVVLLHRTERQRAWREMEMEPLGNDRWRASFEVPERGRYVFTVEAWVDRFETWRADMEKRIDAGQDVAVDLEIGARILDAAAERAGGRAAAGLEAWAGRLRAAAEGEGDPDVALDPDLAALARRHPDRDHATRHPEEIPVWADRERARFGAWYEFFPRSTGPVGRHGTFADAARFLDYVAGLGFDVVYLPPIHPIGTTKRKGPNNATEAGPDDPGSPWAIGSEEGGHTAVHPMLGTLDDFRAFRERARELGLEVALDVAFQCSPDHPWVSEHPEWFRQRPDGTVQYAENPPKKYEDIVPFDFESEAWESLWEALRDVFLFWIDEGVTIFRVDNPHTKPLPFWEWLIGEVRARHPEVILLSEAFTRPRVMHHLAKVGFSQSYTYFAWRNHKRELEAYAREVTSPPVADFFRPAFWPNTPDILTEHLQTGGRPAFVSRLVLAATLAATYGIYGPPFELMESVPREPGSEEYADSEKYQIREWDVDRADSLGPVVERINRIRRDNPALAVNRTLTFHPVDNDALTVYSKTSPDGENVILVAVNLDPWHRQSGWVDLDREALGLDPEETFRLHDLLGGGTFRWQGSRNYVELDPRVMPAHVFRVGRHGKRRDERDFDYYV